MAAAAVWKSFGLDEEYRKLVGDVPRSLDAFASGEGRRVVSATNAFATDPYALPAGADAQLRDLYPRLAELSRESSYISQSALEKMASDICRTPQHIPIATATAFHSALPQYSPAARSFALESPMVVHRARPVADDARISPPTAPPSYRRAEYLRSDYGRDDYARRAYAAPESVERLPPRGAYGPLGSGNIFDSARSRIPYRHPAGDQREYTPRCNKQDDFNFQSEFLSAFQPGVEAKNDYEAMDTPVVDRSAGKTKSRRNSANADALVSPFSWERSVDQARGPDLRCTPRVRGAETSDHRYPSYISRGGSRRGSASGRPRYSRLDDHHGPFDTAWTRRERDAPAPADTARQHDFSARSPIRSLMRDSELSYGYRSSKSPPIGLCRSYL